jgi:hypothetical protein
MKLQITRYNKWFSFSWFLVGGLVLGGLFHSLLWTAIIVLLWTLASWFIGTWLWNRLFPKYITFTDTVISIGESHYSIESIESISIPTGKRIRIVVTFNLPVKPLLVTPWKTKNAELRNQLKRWSIEHGILFSESLLR